MYCTEGVYSSSMTQIFSLFVVLQRYLSAFTMIYLTKDPLNNVKPASLLCHSNNILQSYQPAVQHHLRVLHWGHLSSHDGLQHVSYLHWFIHRSPAQNHWFIYQKSGVPLVNSSRAASLRERRLTADKVQSSSVWS